MALNANKFPGANSRVHERLADIEYRGSLKNLEHQHWKEANDKSQEKLIVETREYDRILNKILLLNISPSLSTISRTSPKVTLNNLQVLDS